MLNHTSVSQGKVNKWSKPHYLLPENLEFECRNSNIKHESEIFAAKRKKI